MHAKSEGGDCLESSARRVQNGNRHPNMSRNVGHLLAGEGEESVKRSIESVSNGARGMLAWLVTAGAADGHFPTLPQRTLSALTDMRTH